VQGETEIGGTQREFPRTRWTLILSSRDSSEARRSALHELLSLYWKPLYFYARRKGLKIESAKDAIQDFCAHLLEKEFVERLDPGKGRFRGYLKTALDRFLINLHEKKSAWKRGGRVATLPLDFDVAEKNLASASEKADAAFDREWALGVMERAREALAEEFARGVRRGPLDVAMKFFRGGDAPSYAEAAKASDMSIPQFKAFLHRTRERFRTLLRERVSHTVDSTSETDAEISDLIGVLAS